MTRRSTLILACRNGHVHRMVTPPVQRWPDGSGRFAVGVLCDFGGVPRLHCLAPSLATTGQIRQITTAPDAPYLWPDEAAARAALAQWLDQED